MTDLNNYKVSASPIYLLATFLVSGWGCVAEAQTTSGQTKPIQTNAEADVTVLDPIVVTARKTYEDLKNVPESITVVPPESLLAAPFDPGAAIARNSPNVQWINRATGSQFFSIRGVSSLGTPVNFSDGTVAFNIDGVPNSLMSASNVLLDVNRIEVMRGPQGTLWGSNALGGAINVVTNQPDGARDIHVTSEIGTNGYRMGEMVLGGNIIPDALDGRMAVRFGHQNGDVRSLFTDDLGERDIAAFRGGLRFTGIDDTTVTLTGSYLRDEGNAPFYLLRNTSRFPISGTLTEPKSVTTQGGTTLTVEHEFDAFRFTSVSAYQHNELDSKTDNADKLLYDQLGFPAFSSRGHLDDKENIFSQELRLNSLEGDPIRWVMGASVARTEGSRTCVSAQCAPAPYFDAIAMDTDLNSTNLGLFGDMSIPFAERWEFSIGGRLNHDDIELKRRNSRDIADLTGSNSTSQTYPTGRMALAYKWTDEVQTYVSLARGHATRVYPLFGYPVNGVVADPYPAATGWTYEAGIKASLFDDRLELDASVYHNDIKNGVMTYLDPALGAFRTTYQDYETSGFELQGRMLISDGLALMGGLGYTHSELGANGANTNTVAGNGVPNTPKWTVTTGLQYDTSASVLNLPGLLSFGMQYQFTGSRPADVDESFDLKPYHIVDARIGWKNDAGDLEFYAFGRNLLDQRAETFGSLYLGVETVAVGPGRIVGLGITKSF
ncbi:TonB-dependent receptor [Rhizobium herbae]|uniref:TonB-dependent receptor n=1 Tax=Rhizobium herbae TaxID=508661 RepID=A0ABS7HEV1_9HYPH|nr:TonB-dependent receptor [Rhizobium herbae]MBW9065816.1 TonB-dependent receptor [Rhizobium herbae]